MTDSASYIRRETGISIVINTVLSLVFFLAVFGTSGAVPVWGMGHYVFDFGPQAFMIALMATLVPGALAGKALRSGKVAAYAGHSRLPRSLWQRALLLAVVSAIAAVAGAAAILALLGLAELPYAPALAAKLGFSAALATAVTPAALRAALIA
jgi:hypothetical protein